MDNVFIQMLNNVALTNAFMAWLLAQLIKFIITFALVRKFDFKKLLASGGMPSSHSATVCALTVSIGITEGFGSPMFAICFVFSFIVMYDALGVRRSAGEQAKVLNQIILDLMEENRVVVDKKLKEILGHTPIEVLMGAIFGILLPFVRAQLFP